MSFRAARCWSALIVAAIGLNACTAAPPSSAAPDVVDPRRGGQVVEGVVGDITTLQPILANDVISQNALGKIYAPLAIPDSTTGEMRPYLGSWTVSPEGLTYRWSIDPRSHWSDGRAITGLDYLTLVKAIARSQRTSRKAAFREIDGFGDYESGAAPLIRGIAVDPADPGQFTVRFARAFCPALASTFGMPVLPTQVFAKYLSDVDVSKNIDAAPENVAPPVASGPFVFRDWRRGDQLILDRNETFFGGAPYLERYIVKVVSDSNVLTAQLHSGELTLGSIDGKDRAALTANPELRIVSYPANGYTYVGWNIRSRSAPALADRKVRQALAFGLDIETVVERVLFGQGIRMVTHHPPASWASPPTGLERYPYDPGRAERLLGDAGFVRDPDGVFARDGRRLEILMAGPAGNKPSETLLQIAVEQYRQIGVRVTPQLVAPEALQAMLASGAVDAWISSWTLGLDPDPYLIWSREQIPDPAAKRGGFNFGGYARPEVEAALVAARTPANGDCSRASRALHYAQFDRLLNEDQPYDFGYSRLVLLVVPANLQGVESGTFNAYANLHRWWLAQ